MSVTRSYLLSSIKIIETYDGLIPFAAWIKNYFREHKKFGSRDRKNILQLCYGFFRPGKAFSFLSIKERILAGVFIVSHDKHPLLEECKPEWNQAVGFSINEKLLIISKEPSLHNIFPYSRYLSADIDDKLFSLSHLQQPRTFIRSRPGKEGIIEEKLENHGLEYSKPIDGAFSLPNSIKIEDIIHLNREAVVQDLSSQQTLIVGDYLDRAARIKAWDCCAASGGKTILLADHYPNAEIWVSDIRESIIANLKKRLQEAGISKYHSFIADISRKDFSIQQKFDLIICDAPCSGSGTWSRTPEQLLFFKEDKIAEYSQLQRKISLNAIKQLNPGGYFLYITCSVFSAENEEQVNFFVKNCRLTLVENKYIKGYQNKADTLFVGLMKKGEL